MAETDIVQTIELIGDTISFFMVLLATIILGIKVLGEKRKIGQFNTIRIIMFSMFLTFTTTIGLEFFLEQTPFTNPILEQFFGIKNRGMGLYNLLVGVLVTLGLTMVAFANQSKELYLAPFYFYSGIIIFWMLSGYDAWLYPYIIAGGLFTIIFLYLTGVRLKDNGSFGLAIFYTLAFLTFALQGTVISQIITIGYSIFILLFSLGYFKPFNQGGIE